MKQSERPTGIIRTLPYFGADKATDAAMNKAFELMMRSFRMMEIGNSLVEVIYIALAQKPTIEVLQCYLLVEGAIRVRANISHYEPGEGSSVKCWDESLRSPKWWAVLTPPVSFAPEPIPRRGFQGFRYTTDLW